MKRTKNPQLTFPAIPVRNRRGSKRRGGRNRYGKGSRYYGGW